MAYPITMSGSSKPHTPPAVSTGGISNHFSLLWAWFRSTKRKASDLANPCSGASKASGLWRDTTTVAVHVHVDKILAQLVQFVWDSMSPCRYLMFSDSEKYGLQKTNCTQHRNRASMCVEWVWLVCCLKDNAVRSRCRSILDYLLYSDKDYNVM